MALNLTENFRKKFVGGVRSRLPDVLIDNNYRVVTGPDNPFADFDEKLPIDSAASAIVKNIISEHPLRDFCLDWLSREFHPREYLEDVGPIHLKYLDGIKDYELLADEIWKDFIGLPYEYKIFLPMPERLHTLIPDDVAVSDLPRGIRIIRWNAELSKIYPEVFLCQSEMPRFRRNYLDVEREGAPEEFLCFELSCSGYFDGYNLTNSNHDALDIIRSFMGVCFALRMIKHSVYGDGKPSGAIFKYRSEDKSIIYEGITPVRGGVFTTFSQISPRFNVNKGRGFYKTATEKINKVFLSRKSDKILLAARWLFDSLIGDNQLLSFVQATICIEILLGDQKQSDYLSISAMLSNRCAYMLGRNDVEREKILDDFRKIYVVRSDIVHKGKSRLSEEDLSKLNLVSSYAARVIEKEIDLIAAA